MRLCTDLRIECYTDVARRLHFPPHDGDKAAVLHTNTYKQHYDLIITSNNVLFLMQNCPLSHNEPLDFT